MFRGVKGGSRPSPTVKKIRANARIFLFHTLFQCGGTEGCQVYPVHAVFGGEDEGFWQVVAGNHLAVLFAFLQKFPGPPGGGGIVQIKDADDGPVPYRHVITNIQVHFPPIPS